MRSRARSVRLGDRELRGMQIGTVAGLWRYPIKSLAAEALREATVERDGFAGDRTTALIVTNSDHPRNGKPLRGKEHRLLHTVASAGAARRVTTASGVTLDDAPPARYFDAQPISLLWDTWLRDVEALVGETLDPLRYRPNLFARATPDFHLREDDMLGLTIGAGSVVLRVVAPIKRCVTTTYDIATGSSMPAVLGEVARLRANIVGIYCTVVVAGTIRCGDPIAQQPAGAAA